MTEPTEQEIFHGKQKKQLEKTEGTSIADLHANLRKLQNQKRELSPPPNPTHPTKIKENYISINPKK